MAGVKQKTITCNISFVRLLMEGGCVYNSPKVIYENVHDPWLNSFFFILERYEL